MQPSSVILKNIWHHHSLISRTKWVCFWKYLQIFFTIWRDQMHLLAARKHAITIYFFHVSGDRTKHGGWIQFTDTPSGPLHGLAKTWIYLTPYVCNERIFNSRPFMYNNTLVKKLLYKLVAHIFTLLLAPFASKSAKFWRHSEPLNKWLKTVKSLFSKENDVNFEFFRSLTRSLRLERGQKKHKDVSYQFI